jgi:integrase
MSHLIKRFKGDLQLAGYAKRNTESYVSSVLRLQRSYNKKLEDITEEDLRQYWPACASHADRLCCQSEFGWSTATLRISYAGIQHFFGRTLARSWNIFNEIKWKREQTLLTILSLQEVRKIIYAFPTLQSHTFYLTLYSLGLRLREATTLQVRDILSDRGLVHIHAGKGAGSNITLTALRTYYKTHRNPQWIFPALGHNGGKDAQFAKAPVSDSAFRGFCKAHWCICMLPLRPGPNIWVALYGNRMPHIHKKAMRDIIGCCSGSFGTIVYACHDCGAIQPIPCCCGNRHCPTCQQNKAD